MGGVRAIEFRMIFGVGRVSPPEEVTVAERVQAMSRLAQCRSRVLISSGNDEPVKDLGRRRPCRLRPRLADGIEKMEQEAFAARELVDDYVLSMVIGSVRHSTSRPDGARRASPSTGMQP